VNDYNKVGLVDFAMRSMMVISLNTTIIGAFGIKQLVNIKLITFSKRTPHISAPHSK
jgi:hypothetical protein